MPALALAVSAPHLLGQGGGSPADVSGGLRTWTIFSVFGGGHYREHLHSRRECTCLDGDRRRGREPGEGYGSGWHPPRPRPTTPTASTSSTSSPSSIVAASFPTLDCCCWTVTTWLLQVRDQVASPQQQPKRTASCKVTCTETPRLSPAVLAQLHFEVVYPSL
jgi:hypothetical protein